MNKLNIVYKKVNELVPYKNNPRINDEAVEYVANSIKEFGFKVPIVIDKDNVIVAGHTRLKACKQLGIDEVPCIIADDLTDEQIKAYRLADNKVSERAQWDFDLLDNELNDILNIDMSQFDFSLSNLELEDNPYTQKTDVPQYEIKDENPDLSELVNEAKTNELIEDINNSNITKEQKEFLIKAATRHYAFNYKNIAEYYAHQNKEMQILMEKSALVIIDYENAIANGFTKLKDSLEGIFDDEE